VKHLPIAAEFASRFAYYKIEYGLGVLGPSGWYCFGTYGSNGANLFLSPQPIDPRQLFDDKWSLKGPAIQFSISDGGTSGRFAVAEAIARVFPAHLAFTRRVIAGHLAHAADFPLGPYPHDKLTYRSNEIVEYQTSANQEGLGTHTRLAMTSTPISGVLALNTKDDQTLYTLALRLPPDLAPLAPIIIQQVEREAK